MIATVKKSELNGSATVPGSKSHTIRSVLLATMAEGESVIRNPLPSLDCKSALGCAEMFGAKTRQEPGVWVVQGRGRDLKVPDNYIDCGNSGSVAYFATPMAALVDSYSFITGDEQIRRRPIAGTVSAINALGGTAFHSRPGSDACPVIVRGIMRGGTARFDGLLSQFASGIMMSAPLMGGDTEILIDDPHEKPYLQITMDWMRKYGVSVENSSAYKRFVISGRRSYTATTTTIASDWSGVAFPLVAGVVCPGEITIEAIDFYDTHGDKAVVDYLISMGAHITKDPENNRIIVRGGNPLHGGVRIDLGDTPDALPAMAVAAAYAEGETTFTGLAHVRLKETDRLAVMESELGKMGARVTAGPDTLTVQGGTLLKGAAVESFHDHRIAMAMTVAGLFAQGVTTINGAECAAVTFPNFYEVMIGIGANVELK